MTADREKLREGLAGTIADILLEGGALSPKHFADRIIACSDLAPILAQADSAERMEAERDEARAEVERLNAVLDFKRREHRVEKSRADRLSAEVEALRARLAESDAKSDGPAQELRAVQILAKLGDGNAWDALLSGKADWGAVRRLWSNKLIAGDKSSLGRCSNLRLTDAGLALARAADQPEPARPADAAAQEGQTR